MCPTGSRQPSGRRRICNTKVLEKSYLYNTLFLFKNHTIYLLFFCCKNIYNSTMKAIAEEKRGVKRFDLEIPAKIKVAAPNQEEEALDLLTSDISSGAAFFPTPEPLAEGTDVKIDLILPISKLCT